MLSRCDIGLMSRPPNPAGLQALLDKKGYNIVMTETELNGPERFAADRVLTEAQCEALIKLANVSAEIFGVMSCRLTSELLKVTCFSLIYTKVSKLICIHVAVIIAHNVDGKPAKSDVQRMGWGLKWPKS